METLTIKIRGTGFPPFRKMVPVLTSLLQCYDGKNSLVAVWELAQRSDPVYARLTLKQPALPMVTELLTTFTLNRISESLNW